MGQGLVMGLPSLPDPRLPPGLVGGSSPIVNRGSGGTMAGWREVGVNVEAGGEQGLKGGWKRLSPVSSPRKLVQEHCK